MIQNFELRNPKFEYQIESVNLDLIFDYQIIENFDFAFQAQFYFNINFYCFYINLYSYFLNSLNYFFIENLCMNFNLFINFNIYLNFDFLNFFDYFVKRFASPIIHFYDFDF